MADKEISSLPAAGSIENEDLFVLEQNGIAKKLSGELLKLFSNATRYETVTTLPSTGEPNVIYLLTSGSTTTMYVYSGGAWQNVGTLNTTAGDATPLMDGTASPGSALPYSRQDHRHPSDTSKAEKAIMDAVVEPLINQWDEQWEVGTYSADTGAKSNEGGRIRSSNFIPVKANTSYYAKVPTTYTAFRVACYDSNKAYLGRSTGWLAPNQNSAFTTPANTAYITFNVTIASAAYNHDISINYPSTYTGYYPAKVSKVDMPWADLLWENASPTSAFASQRIDADLTQYNAYYVLFKYKADTDEYAGQIMAKGMVNRALVPNATFSNSAYRGLRDYGSYIYFYGGYFNGNPNDSYCIPYRIYGIK